MFKICGNAMLNLPRLPSPSELHRMFDEGEITREELHASINVHARALVEEIVDENQNPIAAFLEQRRNRLAAKKLIKKHGSALLREVIVALSNERTFPLAGLFWNASHEDIPLFCFLRTKHPPIFRISEIVDNPRILLAKVAYGADPKALTEETISMRRDWQGTLVVDKRAADS